MDPYRPTGYEPLDTLKPVAEGLWLIDGPAHAHGRIPYPTRATVVRLEGGGLWVHSPTPLTKRLRAEVDALGPVQHLVAPNHAHVAHLGDWAEAYPEAACWAPPEAGVARARDLQASGAEPDWEGQIDQISVRAGPRLTEACFFHRASRSLIVTDLIEAIETQHMPVHLRPVFWLSGTDHTAAHMRPSYRWALKREDKVALADDVEVLIRWRPRRVILAHGRWVPHDGVAALEHAFRKVLRARRWEVAYEEFEKGRGS